MKVFPGFLAWRAKGPENCHDCYEFSTCRMAPIRDFRACFQFHDQNWLREKVLEDWAELIAEYPNVRRHNLARFFIVQKR